jgi:AraC family transcriptional regulator
MPPAPASFDRDSPSAEVRERLLAKRVAGSRYIFSNLAPPRGTAWALALAGREECAADYLLDRASYPFHVVECVAAGRGWVRFDRGREREIGPGAVFAYAPATKCRMRSDPSAPLVKFFFAFAGREVPARLEEAGLAIGAVRRLAAPMEVLGFAEDLIREGRQHRARTPTICLKLAELLLLKIADAGDPSRASDDRARENYLRCKGLMETRMDRPVTLEEVATQVRLDASSICRLFRRFHGASPYQYMLQRKMAMAAEFLIDTGGLVKEAAQLVGFEDPFHFARCFKAVHGVPPSALRGYNRDGHRE